jgi:hypothetical protein
MAKHEQQFESLSMVTWVVFEAADPAGPSHRVWAWCKLAYGPGFTEVAYTEADGITVPQLESAPERLGQHLFTVQVPE